MIAKSTLEGLTTFKFTWDECINIPDCPVIVIVLFAIGVLEIVVMVSVDVFGLAVRR